VTRHCQRRNRAALRFEGAERGDPGDVQRGLGIDRFVKGFRWANKTQFAEGKAQYAIRRLKDLPGSRILPYQISTHADLLRSLTGENPCGG
jgi:hypothetical protein